MVTEIKLIKYKNNNIVTLDVKNVIITNVKITN